MIQGNEQEVLLPWIGKPNLGQPHKLSLRSASAQLFLGD